jgi:hypothetical protein
MNPLWWALWLMWPIGGAAAGLFVANYTYDEYPDTINNINYAHLGSSRGTDAAFFFGITILFFPLIAVVGTFWLIGKGCAWLAPRTVAQLLPAYRRVQQEQRVQTEQDKTSALRIQINEMHAKIGIPPVDWLSKKEIE